MIENAKDYRKFKVVFIHGGGHITIYAKDYQRMISSNGIISHMFHEPRKDTMIEYINNDNIAYIQELEMSK